MAIDVSGSRTYLPKLLGLLKLVCRYISRYRETMDKYLSDDQKAKLSAVMVACDAFTAAVELIQGD